MITSQVPALRNPPNYGVTNPQSEILWDEENLADEGGVDVGDVVEAWMV